MKGITLNYENSKVVTYTTVSNMILKDAAPVHVHNPKEIKRKQVGVVSELETKEYKFVLRSAGLWTAPNPTGMISLFYLFIYLFWDSVEKIGE